MRRSKCGCRCLLPVLGAFHWALAALPVAASDIVLFPPSPGWRSPFDESSRPLGEQTTAEKSTFLAAMLRRPLVTPPPSAKLQLEVAPLVDQCVNLFRAAGVPLRSIHDPTGRHRVSIAASFSMRDDLPPIAFHAGQSARERPGAFFSGRGLSWALRWPAQQFTFGIEGGNHSDFGNFAVAGMQWNHPSRPLAIGIGIPINPRHGAGDVGAIFQLRMKLE